MSDELYNAAERSHVKAAAKAARFDDKSRREITLRIMSDLGGRAWMLDLLTRCHIFSSSFSENPHRVAFAEGERNIGLQLLGDVMAAAPDSYTLMMREKNERDLSQSASRNVDREADSTHIADLVE